MYPEEEACLLRDFSSVQPIFTTDSRHIEQAIALANQPGSVNAHALKALRKEADRALNQEPLTVVNKPILPPSGNKHDYMSVSPYWWPDPDKPDGMPYIRRDGERNPATQKTDRPKLADLIAAVQALGIAYGFTQREDYATHAALLLRTWFIDRETKMNPHLLFGQSIPGTCDGRCFGLIETSWLARDLLPAVRFLCHSASWSEKNMEGLQVWFHAFLKWMLTHPQGIDEARAGNNHSSAYDVQIATYALFAGQRDLAYKIVEGVGARRVANQIEPDGQQPRELARTKALGYASMNLQLLMELAELGRQWGINLAHFETSDGRSIRRAFDWLFPYWTGEREWTLPQIQPFPWERAFGCMRLAAHFYADASLDPVNAGLAGMSKEEIERHIYNCLIPPFQVAAE